MHILFLTDNFPPEVNAPASRTFEHCREWVSLGHRVTVITGVPNFPKGRVFEGYRNRLCQTEDMAGIRVIRVWTYITANEGFARRILDYCSYMIAAILAAPFVRGVDVVVGTSPQLFTVCAAYVVGLYRRVPYVFELRDLWPESIRAVGAMQDSAALRVLERLELFLYRQAAAVVSVTNAFRDNLIRRGIDGCKISVVTNGVDIGRFRPRPKDEALARDLGLHGRFVAGYIGTHGMAHGLETLLEAAALLQELPDGDAYRIVLLGDGASKEALITRARSMNLINVVFLDSVPKDEVVRYWSLLDVAVIHLRKTKLFTTVIPSKLFECMGMGLPVLHGVAGESAGIVGREGVGIVFEPEDAKALCDGLTRLRHDAALYRSCRENALTAAARYDRTALALAMLGRLEAVVGNPTSVQAP
ncbi:MAG: glycosyltransferase family 4 protein [Gammaproteobacteria bacterium]|nr:glycosyltransferase family 4 protein [Gammaproteobacteria bacterium]